MKKPELPDGLNGNFLHIHKMIEWLADEVRKNRVRTDGLYKILFAGIISVTIGFLGIIGILIGFILR